MPMLQPKHKTPSLYVAASCIPYPWHGALHEAESQADAVVPDIWQSTEAASLHSHHVWLEAVREVPLTYPAHRGSSTSIVHCQARRVADSLPLQ